MELNDNKAGMEGLDKEKINALILKATEGTKYYFHQLKQEKQLKEKIEKQGNMINSFSKHDIKRMEEQVSKIVVELERERDLSRTIVHVDMDAFYAAVEMRDDPRLRNKPMAVGGNSMLSTSNYAARKFGVRAAMPGFIARKLCPELLIVPCNFKKYTEVSEKIRNVMAEYDSNFSPVSLDEAYLDLTDYMKTRKNSAKCFYEKNSYGGDCVCYLPRAQLDSLNSDTQETVKSCEKCQLERKIFTEKVNFGDTVEDVVNELRFKIQQKTGLTASAGIAANTLLAKICSDRNKPNGQFFLPSDYEEVINFIRDLPVRKIPGIGGVTESLLKAMGITTCRDLYEQRTKLFLIHSASTVKFLLKASLGLGSSFLSSDSERKSVGVERTFSEKENLEDLDQICEDLCRSLAEDLEALKISGRTVTLKYKTVDFDVKTRATTLDKFIYSFEEIYSEAKKLLRTETLDACGQLKLRLMGVRITNLISSTAAASELKSTAEASKISDFFDNVDPICEKGSSINDVTQFEKCELVCLRQKGNYSCLFRLCAYRPNQT